MTRKQMEITLRRRADGTAEVHLADYPDTEQELLDGLPEPADAEDLEWLADNAERLTAIDDRRAALMAEPEGRAALDAVYDPDDFINGDWDDYRNAWERTLDAAERALS